MIGHRRLKTKTVALVGLLLAALAMPASASVLERLPLKRLKKRAEAVVVARVVSSHGVWADGRIETETVLAIERSWRGPSSGRLRLRTHGGEVGKLRMLVRGAPGFTRNERVLLFLYRGKEAWRPVGMFQGVWRLDPTGSSNAPTQRQLAWPSSTSGARLVELRPGPYAVDGGPRQLSELVGGLSGGTP